MNKSRLLGTVCAAIVRIIGPMSAAILMLQSGSAFSGLIGDRTELEAILGGSLVLKDFESVDLNFPFHAPNIWIGPVLDSGAGIVDGIIFTREPPGSLTVQDPLLLGGNQVLLVNNDAIAIDFLSPTPAFGFDFDRPTNTPTQVTLNVFAEDDVTLLATETIVLNFDGFIGFSETSGIGKATVSSFSVSLPYVTETRIDNVTFGPMPQPGETGPFNAQEYFPLHPGNQATYIVNDTVLHTTTVPDYTVNVNSVPTRPIQVFPDVTEYWTNDGNGIRMHREDLSNGEIAVFNPPITMTAPQFSIGDIYNTNGIQTQTIPGLGVFDLDFSATSGIEAVGQVSVPLGTFPAIRVAATVQTTGVVLGIPVDVTTIVTLWVAQHYGTVWRIDNDPDIGTLDGKLVAVSIDTDEDGVNVTDDNCPSISNPAQTDTDLDDHGDVCDNCTLIANEDQRDTNGDGYGNLCDGDLNNDGRTNTLDLNLYKSAHRSRVGDANYNVDADFNGDGAINTLDLNIYKGLHRQDPGPSCCGLF